MSRPADQALATWWRLGVPEVWRLNPVSRRVRFWQRQADGAYAPIDNNLGLPSLTPADALGQMRLADTLGSARWRARLGGWVAGVLAPGLAGS